MSCVLFLRTVLAVGTVVSVSRANVFYPSVDAEFTWYNQQYDAGCDSGNTLVTSERVTAAIQAQGAVAIFGNLFLMNPNTGELEDVGQRLFGETYRSICLPDPPSSTDISVGPTMLSSPTDYCRGAAPGIDCAWRTDWSVWACHLTEALCVCPFQTTQSSERALFRHRHWIWPASVDPAVLQALTPAAIAALCGPVLPLRADILPVGGQAITTRIPCRLADPRQQNRVCRGSVSTLLSGDPRYANVFPRLLGPQWMYDTFSPAVGDLPSAQYHLVARAAIADPRCVRWVYYSLHHPDQWQRTLTGSCTAATATRFVVSEPIEAVTTPRDRGVMFLALTITGVSLAPGPLVDGVLAPDTSPLTHNTVCWDELSLRACGPHADPARAEVWRYAYIDTSGVMVIALSADHTRAPIALRFVAVAPVES
jgi:hypothetical protein